MPENKPDYWEIYPANTKTKEWRAHLCDGNNNQIILSSENYKNLKDAFLLVNKRKNIDDEVDFYPTNSSKPVLVQIEVGAYNYEKDGPIDFPYSWLNITHNYGDPYKSFLLRYDTTNSTHR